MSWVCCTMVLGDTQSRCPVCGRQATSSCIPRAHQSVFTQADLDAAILAERTRCAGVCRELSEQYPDDYDPYVDGWRSALYLAEQRIKEGK